MRVLPALLTLGLMSSSALAADLLEPVVPVEPVVVEEAFTWTGFYVGVDVGWAFAGDNGNNNGGNNRCRRADGFDCTGFRLYGDSDNVDELEGWFAGGDVGYLYQTGAFVFGIEGDLKWADIDTGNNDNYGRYGHNNFDLDHGLEVDWLGTARLSAGWAAFDRALIYVTGGFAFGGLEAHLGCNQFFDARGVLHCRGGGSEDDTEVGWTVGAGAKYAFTDNIVAGFEYKFIRFEDVIDDNGNNVRGRRFNVNVDDGGRNINVRGRGVANNDVDIDLNTFTFKLDYLF